VVPLANKTIFDPLHVYNSACDLKFLKALMHIQLQQHEEECEIS